jgi:hypothetical protein
MIEYRVVFDANQAAVPWWFCATGLVLGAAGVVMFLRRRRWRFLIFAVFGVGWSVVAGSSVLGGVLKLRRDLDAGRCTPVEGVVTDFVPGPANGHPHESFNVEGHHYDYSDYVIVAGFHHTQGKGGPVRAGQHVRIQDCRGQIGRLEIAVGE